MYAARLTCSTHAACLDENGLQDICATEGTARFLNNNGIEAQAVCWPDEEGENVLDLIAGHGVDLIIINIPKNHTKREFTNGYRIRRWAIDHKYPAAHQRPTCKRLRKGLHQQAGRQARHHIMAGVLMTLYQVRVIHV